MGIDHQLRMMHRDTKEFYENRLRELQEEYDEVNDYTQQKIALEISRVTEELKRFR